MGKERDEYFSSLADTPDLSRCDKVKIGDRQVGIGYPTFIIAEVGANHRGDINLALKLIDKAKEAGADAVKFQHLAHDKIAADTVVYESWHDKEIGPLSGFYKSSELPYEWTPKLIAHAKKIGLMFLSTPFDLQAVDVLDRSGVAAFKVASYELTDDILISYMASKGRPMIISTGMADLEEVAHAVNVVRRAGSNQIILLHCVSIYPPKFKQLNLKAITTLREAFKLPVGYSDHSEPPYIAAGLAAVALGACVIEKHITDDQEGASNDDPNSMEVSEFQRFVKEVRNLEAALSGSGIKQPVNTVDHVSDEISDRWARRSVYALVDMKKGEAVTLKKIITLRPWGGIVPKDFHLFEGRKLRRPIKARQPLTAAHFED